MIEFLTHLFDVSDFPARWNCGDWTAGHGWLHILSDLAVFGAYMAIPFVLIFFMRKRRDIPFPRIFFLFAAFIFACGTVHLIEATIFWWPIYRVSGIVKFVTAVISVGTVFALIPVVPNILAMRSPHEVESKAEASFFGLLESAPDAMVIVNSDGEISRVNKQTQTLFGYAAEELIGQPVEMLMPERYRENHPRLRTGFVERPQTRQMGEGQELFGISRDGTEFPVEISLSPIQTAEGTLTCSAIRDVTEKLRNQEQLVHSERLSAIGEAMTGLIHESRNALARSQAGLKLLSREIGDRPNLFRFIDESLQAQKDLQHLFEEVRQYAVPPKLEFKPVRLPDIVKGVWDQLAHIRGDRDVEISQGFDGVDVQCELDGFSIGNIFRNLIENSLAACTDPVRMTVTYRDAEVASQPALEIAFSDNGPGLGEEQAKHVFDAFYTTKTHGTGLGMAISKRSVEQHKGTINLNSNNDAGAEFVITLPRGTYETNTTNHCGR